MYAIMDVLEPSQAPQGIIKVRVKTRQSFIEVKLEDKGDISWAMVNFIDSVNNTPDVYFRKTKDSNCLDIVGKFGVILKLKVDGSVPNDSYLNELIGK